MSANAFDTLKAAKSLKAAGFDEAQAEALVATVDEAVRGHTTPLANGIAAIEDGMATKDEVANISGKMATKDEVANVSGKMATRDEVANISGKMATKDEVANISGKMATRDEVATITSTMATKDYVAAEVAGLRAEMAAEFKALYRHLWVMGAGGIGVTVALIKLLP